MLEHGHHIVQGKNSAGAESHNFICAGPLTPITQVSPCHFLDLGMLAAMMPGSLRIFQKSFLPKILFTLYPRAHFNYKSDKYDMVGLILFL